MGKGFFLLVGIAFKESNLNDRFQKGIKFLCFFSTFTLTLKERFTIPLFFYRFYFFFQAINAGTFYLLIFKERMLCIP